MHVVFGKAFRSPSLFGKEVLYVGLGQGWANPVLYICQDFPNMGIAFRSRN